MKFIFKTNADQILVFRLGTTSNTKISKKREKIVQTYSFSFAQYNHARTQKGAKNTLYQHDNNVCFDCPLRGENGDCYTHKFNQTIGFYSMLRSLPSLDKIPFIDGITSELLDASKDRYIRFGTYGEPVLVPIDWMEALTGVAKSWTGYSHQWRNEKYQDYSKYFMASTHTKGETFLAEALGWRAFQTDGEDGTHCPASKEMGFKSHCSKCGLCSGVNGKGKTHIKIEMH